MREFTVLLRRAANDPRLRVALVLLLLFLVLVMALHLVVMADHTSMVGGWAAAVVVIGLFLVIGPRPSGAISILATSLPSRPVRDVPSLGGRHPPDEGTVLRL